jgi:hypothetical protein
MARQSLASHQAAKPELNVLNEKVKSSLRSVRIAEKSGIIILSAICWLNLVNPVQFLPD